MYLFYWFIWISLLTVYETFDYIIFFSVFLFFQMNFTESFIKVPEIISRRYENINLILASGLFLFFYFWKLPSFFQLSWNLFRPSLCPDSVIQFPVQPCKSLSAFCPSFSFMPCLFPLPLYSLHFFYPSSSLFLSLRKHHCLSFLILYFYSLPPCFLPDLSFFYLSSFKILRLLSGSQMRGSRKVPDTFQGFAFPSGQSPVIFPSSLSCGTYKLFAGPYKPSKWLKA